MEEEDEDGFTRLSLCVSPRVDLADESAVVEAMLDQLPPDAIRSLWTQAGTFQVKRADPVWTERGKLMPLHLERRVGRPSDEPAGRPDDTGGTA